MHSYCQRTLSLSLGGPRTIGPGFVLLQVSLMVDPTEIRVQDIMPGTFPRLLRDRQGDPIALVRFRVAADSGEEMTGRIDGSGQLKVVPPKNEMQIPLTAEMEGIPERGPQ
jgi:hypothetical protein